MLTNELHVADRAQQRDVCRVRAEIDICATEGPLRSVTATALMSLRERIRVLFGTLCVLCSSPALLFGTLTIPKPNAFVRPPCLKGDLDRSESQFERTTSFLSTLSSFKASSSFVFCHRVSRVLPRPLPRSHPFTTTKAATVEAQDVEPGVGNRNAHGARPVDRKLLFARFFFAHARLIKR